MMKPKKILVPTDFSEYSDKAVERALDIAKQNDAEVSASCDRTRHPGLYSGLLSFRG